MSLILIVFLSSTVFALENTSTDATVNDSTLTIVPAIDNTSVDSAIIAKDSSIGVLVINNSDSTDITEVVIETNQKIPPSGTDIDSNVQGLIIFDNSITISGHNAVVNNIHSIHIAYSGSYPNNTLLTDNVSSDSFVLSSSSGDNPIEYTWNTGKFSGLRTFYLGGQPLLVNDQPVQVMVWSDADEFVDAFNNVTLTINQENSSISGNVDFTNETIRWQDIRSVASEYGVKLTNYIDLQSSILNSVAIDMSLEKGQQYPTYRNIHFNDTYPLGNIISGYFLAKNIPCTVTDVNNQNYSCLNQAINKSGLNVKYDSTMSIYKSGVSYYVYLDEGYNTFNNNTIKNITDIINNNVQTLNPVEFFQNVVSYVNSTGVFSMSNITTDSVTLTNSAGNVTYDLPSGSFSVNTSQVPLVSGNYTLTVKAKDQYGNTASKNMTVVINIATESTSSTVTLNSSDVNGSANITFANPTVSDIITKIVIPNNATTFNFTVSAQVYGSTMPTVENVTAPIASETNNPMVYIVFNSTVPLVNNSFTIYFDVPKATLGTTSPSNVVLFVYENNAWTALPTTVIDATSDPVQFSAITPHFSTFVIGSQQCSDGTAYNSCSISKPNYCQAGTLVSKASLCGCPPGQSVSGDSCYTPSAPSSVSGGGGGGGGIIYIRNTTTVAQNNVTVAQEQSSAANTTNATPATPVVSNPQTSLSNESNTNEAANANANAENSGSAPGITGQVVSNVAPVISTTTAIWLILGVIVLGVLAYVFYKKRSK